MKTIKLTKGKETIVDAQDYEYLNQFKWYYSSNGYAMRDTRNRAMESGRVIGMHNIINNTPIGMDTDHINGNRLDNRRENLRTASRTQNNGNRDKGKNNNSGYKGVSLIKKRNRWRATLNINNKRIHLGCFIIKEEAAQAYNDAAIKYFGEFAKLNEIKH